jgi:hypothetical protein
MSLIYKRNINLKVYSFVFKVLKQSMIYKELIPLLSFKEGI